MKFGPSVLLEIMDILRRGLVEQKDVSQMLRDVELVVDQEGNVSLDPEYEKKRGGGENL